MWQYTTLLDTDSAETSLQKKDSDTRWHNLGPEASARLDWAFDFALVGNTLEISVAPHTSYKMRVVKIYRTGMEMNMSQDKLKRRFLMKRAGVNKNEKQICVFFQRYTPAGLCKSFTC